MGNNSSSHDLNSSRTDRKGKKHKHKHGSKNLPRPLDDDDTENSQPNSGTPQKAAATQATKSEAAPFVMISYSRSNQAFLDKIISLLQQHKVKIWHDQEITAGTDFLKNIGQAVIDCSVFIYLISPDSIKSKYCQDELALAYISNKVIVPVTEQKPGDLFPLMDTGTKLQLARMKWFVFDTNESFVGKSDNFITNVKQALLKSPDDNNMGMQDSSGGIMRTMSSPGSESEETDGTNDEEYMSAFWERHFGKEAKVAWPLFIEKFSQEYKEELDMIFKESKNKVWLMSILHKELDIQRNEIYHVNFDSFCLTAAGRRPFWIRVQEYAVENYSIKEVFKMESSVRVEAIENLGKYKSPSVIEALLDLLRDEDDNCRAVAAISLARTETTSEIVMGKLVEILEDKDRLVRESACLALGHLKAEIAVPKLVHLWRNDFISSVRDAAELALEQIGGEQANQAIHMTRVLTNEIKQLVTL